jgi:hypothetical protein
LRNLLWYIYAPPQEQNARLRIDLRDKHLVVLARGPGPGGKDDWREILRYSTDPALRPYIHPLRDPSGQLVLTDDRPGDHPWQHGIFTGLHKVNGLDFWTEKQGKQRFVKLLDVQREEGSVSWRALVEWVAPNGDVLLDEEQAITVNAPTSADGYSVDFEWSLRTRWQGVAFGKHDYGGLSVRMPHHRDHTHLNAVGQRHKETANNKAAWCTVERPFGDETWGIAVFDHPSNLHHPARWRVDGQGLINPSPALQEEWSLGSRRKQVFRYHILVYRGPGKPDHLATEFERFSANKIAAAK